MYCSEQRPPLGVLDVYSARIPADRGQAFSPASEQRQPQLLVLKHVRLQRNTQKSDELLYTVHRVIDIMRLLQCTLRYILRPVSIGNCRNDITGIVVFTMTQLIPEAPIIVLARDFALAWQRPHPLSPPSTNINND